MQTPVSIGRYRIESLLGRGAMGVVYKAHDPDIDRPVAIKLIRANLLDGESREQYLLRFRAEAKIAGRCMHANIVGVHDFSPHEGSPFLVMEYVEGADLSRAFPRGTPNQRRRGCPRRVGRAGRARLRAWFRNRASRHQARQHPADAGARPQGGGFRDLAA